MQNLNGKVYKQVRINVSFASDKNQKELDFSKKLISKNGLKFNEYYEVPTFQLRYQ